MKRQKEKLHTWSTSSNKSNSRPVNRISRSKNERDCKLVPLKAVNWSDEKVNNVPAKRERKKKLKIVQTGA